MALQPDNELSRTKIKEEANETGPDTFAADVIENGIYGDDIKYVRGPTLKEKNPPKHEISGNSDGDSREAIAGCKNDILYLLRLFQVSFHSVSTQHWN